MEKTIVFSKKLVRADINTEEIYWIHAAISFSATLRVIFSLKGMSILFYNPLQLSLCLVSPVNLRNAALLSFIYICKSS